MVYGLQPDSGAEQAMLDATVTGLDAQGAQIADLSERIRTLETVTADQTLGDRLQALEEGEAGGQELAQRLDALESEVAAQAQALQAAGTGSGDVDTLLGQLRERVDSVEQAIAQAPTDQPSATADALRERVTALESTLSELSGAMSEGGGGGEGSGDRDTAVAALEARLAMLEAKLPDPAAAEQATSQISALEQRLATAEQSSAQVGNLVSTVDEVRSTLQTSQERIAGVGDEVTSVRDRITDVSGNVQTLEERLAGLQNRLDSAQDRRERAATLALLTTQLDAALTESRPYDRLLATLTELAKDDPAVEQAVANLEPAADTGIPDLTTLRQRFSSTANEIVHQANAPEGDGLIDRATGNLMRLVTVRPVGADTEGESPEARVARAEAKLAEGDLAGAVAEIEQLQGAPAAAAAEWLEAARARLAAEEAVADLQAHTTAMLTEAQ